MLFYVLKILKNVVIRYFFTIFVGMKKVAHSIAISLSLVFLCNALLSGYYLSYYLLSKGAFVATYCQNKAHPERHCQGACKFAELTGEQPQAPISQQKPIAPPEVFYQNFPSWELEVFTSLVSHCYYYTSLKAQQVLLSWWRPPKMSE